MSPAFLKICADFNEPILFRTTSADVYASTLRTGSLWLRSDQYYREVEDKARHDEFEGVNAGKSTIPLQFELENGQRVKMQGPGHVGQQIIPHYILSLHGTSLSREQLKSFGECTFGIKNTSRLSAEILYRSSLILKSVGYRYGAVRYQFASLAQSHNHIGSAAMSIGGTPPIYLNPIDTDVLRKLPIAPFIEQDEWRIVVFTEGYLGGDPAAPLRINVDPSHFYPYQQA